MSEVPDTVDDAVDALGATPTSDEVFFATLDFPVREVAAAALAGGGGGGGGGTVADVTAADTSVVVSGTTSHPTVRTNTLDVIAAQHPPVAAVALNGQKITGLASGLAGTDAATIAQLVSLSGGISPLNYGAKADAKTLGDGVTNGTTTFVSATASFVAGDVGKTIVINNAVSAGVHLYTTIASRTNSTTVVLTAGATASVTGAVFSYGTDDSAARDSALAAAIAANGTFLHPPTAMLVKSAGVIDGPVNVIGTTISTTIRKQLVVSGSYSLGTECQPQVAPYLLGSVTVVAAANTDAWHITCPNGGISCNMANLGVLFAGMFASTGTAFRGDATRALDGVHGNGHDNGVIDCTWQNLYVMGNDKDHYGFEMLNPLLNTLIHLRVYGGPGFNFFQDSTISSYGNIAAMDCYVGVIAGGYGFRLSNDSGDAGHFLNLCTFTRCQSINGYAYAGGVWDAWGAAVNNAMHDLYYFATRCALVSCDFEIGNVSAGAGTIFISADTLFLGSPSWYANDTGAGAGTVPLDYPGDNNSSRARTSKLENRLLSAEASGTFWRLLSDDPQSANWALTTDGTVQALFPGVIRHTGVQAPTAVAGAALGTTPPPVIVTGADSCHRFIFGSGGSATTGLVGTFTLSRALQVGAVPTVQAENSATAALGLYAVALSSTTFGVYCVTGPTSSQSLGTYAAHVTLEDACAAPVAPVVYESFTKSNSSSTVGSPQIGSAPTATGTWGISSNAAYNATNSGGHDNLAYDASVADCTVQVTLTVVDGSNGGVILRGSAADRYLIVFFNSLYSYAAGTYAQIGSSFSGFSSGDVFKAVLSGTSIKIYRNGIQTFSGTSSFNQTSTKHGLFAAATTTARWKNFSVT